MVKNIADEEEYKRIILILKGERPECDLNRYQIYRLRNKAKNFIIIDDVLYLKAENGLHKKVFYLTQVESMKLEVERLHNENHCSQNRTHELCKDHFFAIPRTIVREVVANCNVCKTAQLLQRKEVFKHVTANFCFERIIVDLIDLEVYKTANEGFCWVLTMLDVYSKFARAFPLKNKSATEVCNALESLFFTFGPPIILQSDNGKEFTNSEVKNLCLKFNVKLIHGSGRHFQTQGQIERLNQTITRSIAKQISAHGDDVKEACWIKYIDKVVYNYNTAVHSATNKSPFELFYNRKGFNTVVSPDNYVEKENSNDILVEEIESD